jgi:enterochelin esterase family protein
MWCLLIVSITRAGRKSCRPIPFADFMAHELLPWLRQQAGCHSPKNRCRRLQLRRPGRIVVALRYPRLFANVLSLSGFTGGRPKARKPAG